MAEILDLTVSPECDEMNGVADGFITVEEVEQIASLLGYEAADVGINFTDKNKPHKFSCFIKPLTNDLEF